MSDTNIEWTTMTYNPWVGCSKVSPGCLNCYAERMAKRLKGMGIPQYRDVVDGDGWTGKLRPRPDGFAKLPGERAAPKLIFVGSMTDPFHEEVPFNVIKTLFLHMLASGSHNTFQILTKRIKRAVEFFDHYFKLNHNPKFWIMTTICNQEEADENIPELLKIDAFVRGVSVEPMLGPVDFKFDEYGHETGGVQGWQPERSLDWVICSAETGPGARHMMHHWARDLLYQCDGAGIPFFFKRDSYGQRLLCSTHDPHGRLWEQYPERRES